jgi:hypothetical protein
MADGQGRHPAGEPLSGGWSPVLGTSAKIGYSAALAFCAPQPATRRSHGSFRPRKICPTAFADDALRIDGSVPGRGEG